MSRMLLSTLFPIYYSLITLPFDTELLQPLLRKTRMNFRKTFFTFTASSHVKVKANIFNHFIYSTTQRVRPETWHILLALSLPMLIISYNIFQSTMQFIISLPPLLTTCFGNIWASCVLFNLNIDLPHSIKLNKTS
jgi:hypothetical protein